MDVKKSKQELKSEYNRILNQEKLIAETNENITWMFFIYFFSVIFSCLMFVLPEEKLDLLTFNNFIPVQIYSIFIFIVIFGTILLPIIYFGKKDFKFFENYLVVKSNSKILRIVNFDDIKSIKLSSRNEGISSSDINFFMNFEIDVYKKNSYKKPIDNLIQFEVSEIKENIISVNNKILYYGYERILPNKLLEKVDLKDNVINQKEKRKVLQNLKQKRGILQL